MRIRPSSNPWEKNAAYWVQIITGGHDRYRTELTDSAMLSAIDNCREQLVLDAGCGEGYLTREMVSRGARVVAVDSSLNLIGAAKRSCPGPGCGIACASVEALPLRDRSFDLVVCNHLFSHLRDPRPAIKEFGRVLMPGGRLIILTLHPCFYDAHAERESISAIPASTYFKPRGIEQKFLVDGLESPATITSWLRPLESYTAALRNAGFVITDLQEPHPTDAQLSDPWWREGFKTALFILFIAEKK